MAAPHQQGLKFFSFYTKMFDEEVIQELIELHRGDGFLFLMQLYTLILGQGNVIVWSPTVRRSFYKKHGYVNQHEQVQAYMETLFSLDLLNKAMFEEYNVLTSVAIQDTYIKCKNEGLKVIFIKEYLLIDFADYNYFKQVIHVYERDPVRGYYNENNLLERFTKKGGVKIDPDTGLPLKGKNQTGKSGKSRSTPTKPAGFVKPEQAKPSYNPYTYQQLLSFIKISYDDQNDNFKNAYSREEFDGYVSLNKIVDERFINARKSDRQLRIDEYIDFVKAMGATNKSILNSFKSVSKLAIGKDTDIYKALAAAHDHVIEPEPSAPEQEPEQEPENYEEKFIPDETLEKEVREFFGISQLRHDHQNHVALRAFLTVLHYRDDTEHFREQFNNYMAFKRLSGLQYKHSFKNFIGEQKERFENGAWDTENWEMKLLDEQIVKEQKKSGLITVGYAQQVSKAEQSIESHDMVRQYIQNKKNG